MPTSTSEPDGRRLRDGIVGHARSLGFDEVGIAEARQADRVGPDLESFLAQGLHGSMDWMARRAAERADPRALWPAARSVIVVAANYGPETDPRAEAHDPARGVVSVYARGRDYHDVLKGRLRALGTWIAATHGAEVKVFVDTAPVMEKPLAEAAGIGWQGKHTNLVSRRHGSWLFLGEVFTTLVLPPDQPEADHCGTCHACLDACPTGAFLGPYRIDARRCISYLTIEHKGPIAAEFRVPMGNRIYGCDDCLAVCPWNKYATPTTEPAFKARAGLDAPLLADLSRLDDAGFRARFAGSPIKRTGRDRFVRNVMIAVGNSADGALAPLAEDRLTDASPLVRGMAVWALARLAPGRFAALKARHEPAEQDAHVREEWAAVSVVQPTPSSQTAIAR